VHGVAAGLHLLVTFPRPASALDDTALDDTVLVDELRTRGVQVHPLSWHRQRPGPPGLVLGYAAQSPDRLREAAAVIARVVRRAVRR